MSPLIAPQHWHPQVMAAHALELDPNWPAGAERVAAVAPEGKRAASESEPPVFALPEHMDRNNLGASFKPERWLDPNPENRPTILGFGYGPHNCIGTALYIIEAKTVSP